MMKPQKLLCWEKVWRDCLKFLRPLWLGFGKSLNASFSQGKVDFWGRSKTKPFHSLFLAW